ncbi:hypothetical protein D3C80_671670 [compost metagenome]
MPVFMGRHKLAGVSAADIAVASSCISRPYAVDVYPSAILSTRWKYQEIRTALGW